MLPLQFIFDGVVPFGFLPLIYSKYASQKNCVGKCWDIAYLAKYRMIGSVSGDIEIFVEVIAEEDKNRTIIAITGSSYRLDFHHLLKLLDEHCEFIREMVSSELLSDRWSEPRLEYVCPECVWRQSSFWDNFQERDFDEDQKEAKALEVMISSGVCRSVVSSPSGRGCSEETDASRDLRHRLYALRGRKERCQQGCEIPIDHLISIPPSVWTIWKQFDVLDHEFRFLQDQAIISAAKPSSQLLGCVVKLIVGYEIWGGEMNGKRCFRMAGTGLASGVLVNFPLQQSCGVLTSQHTFRHLFEDEDDENICILVGGK